MRSLFNIFYFLLYFRNFFMFEAISKFLKIVKAPSLRSDKGSVFPPSHKATAGQAPVTLQVAAFKLPFIRSKRGRFDNFEEF